MRMPIFSLLHQQNMLSNLLISANPISKKWYLSVYIVFPQLLANVTIFMCLKAILYLFLVTSLFLHEKASSRHGHRLSDLAAGMGPALLVELQMETCDLTAPSAFPIPPANWADRIQFLPETESLILHFSWCPDQAQSSGYSRLWLFLPFLCQ